MLIPVSSGESSQETLSISVWPKDVSVSYNNYGDFRQESRG